MTRWLLALVLVLVPLATGPAVADEVVFLNGDRLTGTIVSAAGGKLVLKTEAAGDVTIDLAKVKTFSTAAPVQVRVGGEKAPLVTTPIGSDGEGKVETTTAPGAPQTVAIADINAINPPAPEWKGRIALNGLFTTGNSETQQIGFNAALGKRWEDDALAFAAQYSYGRQKDQDTGVSTTTIDYAMFLARYEHYFTKKFYGYAQVKFERDGVAELNVRVAPSIGAGYAWFEGPTFNLKTEAGLAWIYEDYEKTGSRDYFAPRLAYYVDWTPVDPLKLFHSLEYLPSFDDFTGKYLLNIDAGLRAGMWKGLFAEFKIEYRYNADPEAGRKKADTRYVVGLGWEF